MRLGVFAFAIIVTMLVVRSVEAAPPMVTRTPLDSGDASVVRAAPPSAAHRWGTATIYGGKSLHEGDFEQALVGVEIDLFDRRVVGRFEIDRKASLPVGKVYSARVGDETFVVAATGYSGDPAVLYSLDANGHVLERTVIDEGEDPAIVPSDAFVVVGLYEGHPPVLPPDPSYGWQPRAAYHVRVYERATRRLVGARVFRGDVLLAGKPQLTAQMLALRDQRLFVSLPMIDQGRIIGVRLPSLATEAQIDVPIPHDPIATVPIAAYDHGIVALGDDWIELSDDLTVKRRRAVQPSVMRVAVQPETQRLAVDRSVPQGLSAKTWSADLDSRSMTWAWGHVVVLGVDSDGTPGLLVIP